MLLNALHGFSARHAFEFAYTFSADAQNVILKDLALAAGWDGITPLLATYTVPNGRVIGSSSAGSYALQVGAGIPAGSLITLTIESGGFVVGKGGDGGAGQPYWAPGGAGTAGGSALYADSLLTISNSGTIGGGGGGGGGGAGKCNADSPGYVVSSNGGGGAGNSVGAGGAGNATLTAGGSPSTPEGVGTWGGTGGGLGTAGGNGTAGCYPGGPGGAAGAAVAGNANIAWLATGTRLGSVA